MKPKHLLLLALPVTLSSCAMHMSQEECAGTNWRQLGYQDGLSGNQRNLQQDILDCSKYNINVNTQAYNAGNAAGLSKYCSYDRGYQIANQGQPQAMICEQSSYPQYGKGYRSGLQNFCTYTHGYYLGSRGLGNPGVCNNSQAFSNGYRKGSISYCSKTRNGYALGRNGGAYPTACTQDQFPSFYDAYQSGRANFDRISDLQNQLNDVNNRINSLVMEHHYKLQSNGKYRLSSHHTSDSAEDHLNEVNSLLNKRKHLENRIYRLQMGSYEDNYSKKGTNININIRR